MQFENPMYDGVNNVSAREGAGGGSKLAVGLLVNEALSTNPRAGLEATYANANGIARNISAFQNNGNADDDYANAEVTDDYANAEVTHADYANAEVTPAAKSGGNGLVDENNHYDMPPPGRRRTGSSSNSSSRGATESIAAVTLKGRTAKSGTGGKQRKGNPCTRPSPKGGACKNIALTATLFCKGHTCPIQGCTNGKSTKMETCPEHVHTARDGSSSSSSSSSSKSKRRESGEVFYDSYNPTGGSGGGGSGAAQTGNNDIYAQSTKRTVRSKKTQQQQQQQQQQRQQRGDANATYATPVRPVLEQDYVALNEMPSNDEASMLYAVATTTPTSSSDAGAAIPEPTKVGSGTVVLRGASKQVESEEEDEMDC